MKKRFFILPMVMLLTIMLGITGVKASFTVKDKGVVCQTMVTDGSTAYQICDLGFEITEKDMVLKNFSDKITLTNLTLKDSDITLADGWKYTKNSDGTFTFNPTTSTFKVGYHKIATIKVYKVVYGNECKIVYAPSFTVEHPTCTLLDGVYYGKSGQVLENELAYQKECEKNVCVQLSDGTYWGKDGTQVEQPQFEKECTEHETKHYCEKVDNDYYDKDGNTTTKIKYELECQNHYCSYITDEESSCENTNTDDTDNNYQVWCNENSKKTYYYNQDGQNVKKAEYEEDCFEHICSVVNGKYYNSKGEVVATEEEYKADCEKIVEEKHICEIVDDKYYGKDGSILKDKAEFDKECGKHSCEIVDGKYYDKDGKEISKEEYDKDCSKHSCEIVDDKYYDKDGKEISKKEYEKLCPNKTNNPNTGSFLPFLPIGILAVGGVAIYLYTRKDQLVK